MPGTEELMARLQQLEDGYYGDKEAARQSQFFDTYGSRFSNNRGLGLAILNELDARGIDTSAADEAVTQIIDQLRTECNEIIESLKEVQQEAIEQAQKVEEIGNVVSQAVASNPDANAMPMDAGMTQEMPPADLPDEMQDAEELNMDALNEPPAGDEMPMEEPPAEEVPPEEPPAEEAPAEELPPDQAVSDARMKNIRGTLTGIRQRRTSGYKPSAGILNAAMGGR